MTEQVQEERREVTIPISCCSICDKDRDPLEVPDESCGHDHEYAEIRNVPAVPKVALDQALAERDQIRKARDEAQRRRSEITQERDRLAEALREIAEHDWTAPPDEMPDEMARRSLSSYEALKEEAKAQAPKPHEQ